MLLLLKMPTHKKVSENEAIEIGMRLHQASTKSKSGEAGEPSGAEDLISRKNVSESEVNEITERLYKTPILMATIDPDSMGPRAEDRITKKQPKNKSEVDEITERLNTTYPKCQSGDIKPPEVCNNTIAKKVESEDEVKEIFARLRTTHTKSSSGGVPCKQSDPPKPIGFGTKCYPIVEDIESKFKGAKPVPKEKYDEITDRLLKTQTCNSQARLDNPKVLLYPERTKLMNNVDRIRNYQDSGSVVKQKEMERREKWYN